MLGKDIPQTPPEWDNQSGSCALCTKDFGVINRRHHCRLCGDSICDSCSLSRLVIPFQKYGNFPQRVCDNCYANTTGTGSKLQVDTKLPSSVPSQPKIISKRHVGVRTRIMLDIIDDLNEEIHMDFMVIILF